MIIIFNSYYILFMISIIIGLSYLLFFIRGKKFSTNIPLIMNKRNLFLLSSSGILFLSILIILMGTTFPILARALNYGEVVVGEPYFDIVLFIRIEILQMINEHKNNTYILGKLVD